MLKNLLIILAIIALLFLIGFGVWFYFSSTVPSDPVEYYYEKLSQECRLLSDSDSDCCLTSVDIIKTNSYFLAPVETLDNQGCPADFRERQLDCAGSLRWCEAEQIKAEPDHSKDKCDVNMFACATEPCYPQGKTCENIAYQCYYPCDTDRDCPSNMKCVRELECYSGDSVELIYSCQ